MSEHKFEELEHTADIGIIARGETIAHVFENAACGMISLLAKTDNLTPSIWLDLKINGIDLCNLLQAWLTEILFIMDSKRLLPIQFKIFDISESTLTGRVGAVAFSPDIEWLGPGIKAVTYHRLSVEQKEGEWVAKVIFDV